MEGVNIVGYAGFGTGGVGNPGDVDLGTASLVGAEWRLPNELLRLCDLGQLLTCR